MYEEQEAGRSALEVISVSVSPYIRAVDLDSASVVSCIHSLKFGEELQTALKSCNQVCVSPSRLLLPCV